MFDRRSAMAGGLAFGSTLASTFAPAFASGAELSAKPLRKAASPGFPQGFLWGASTAPHQIEGNNVSSDLWYLEHQQPTVFKEPSGDAANSFLMWERDLDLARDIGRASSRPRGSSAKPCSTIIGAWWKGAGLGAWLRS
jgi:beta-glucosidase